MPGRRKRTMDTRQILRHLRQGGSDPHSIEQPRPCRLWRSLVRPETLRTRPESPRAGGTVGGPQGFYKVALLSCRAVPAGITPQ